MLSEQMATMIGPTVIVRRTEDSRLSSVFRMNGRSSSVPHTPLAKERSYRKYNRHRVAWAKSRITLASPSRAWKTAVGHVSGGHPGELHVYVFGTEAHADEAGRHAAKGRPAL